jgi:hypothetical protein
MKAWLKWDEYVGYCLEYQLDDYEIFSPDEPFFIWDEEDYAYEVLVSQSGVEAMRWVPMEFISLEPITPDVY